jgi:hypothetical protein
MTSGTIDRIDANLAAIHVLMSNMAAAVNSMTPQGKESPSGTGLEPRRVGGTSVRPLSSFDIQEGQMSFGEQGELVPTEREEEEKGRFTTEDLVGATYALHETTHAMRGYLMLLDQMGLNKDQKKMVRDLEYAMMLVTKLTTAMNILISLETKAAAGEAISAPELFLPLFIAGGMGSASFGYAHKLSGGQT